MQFLMLMIPAVYQGKGAAPDFVPDAAKIEAMGKFNEEMGKALKIVSLNGLHPLVSGVRVAFGKGKPTVTDGPFIEAKEVLGGYWMVEADSKEEVLKWTQRCPADPGDVIEIRQIFDLADFEAQEMRASAPQWTSRLLRPESPGVSLHSILWLQAAIPPVRIELVTNESGAGTSSSDPVRVSRWWR